MTTTALVIRVVDSAPLPEFDLRLLVEFLYHLALFLGALLEQWFWWWVTAPFTQFRELVVGLLDNWIWIRWLPVGYRVAYGGFLVPLAVKWYAFRVVKWVRFNRFLLKHFWLLVLRKTVLGWLLEYSLAWVLRGSWAPPSVLRGEDIYIAGVPAPEADLAGNQFAQAAGITFASVTAGGLTPARCRRRSRWVRSLQEYLGGRDGAVGELIRGRWIPDLPSSDRPLAVNTVLALLDGDTKVLGGGLLRCDDPEANEPFIICQRDSGREVIVPNLLGRLCRNTFGRERDSSLLAQLRSRAVEWCVSHKVVESVIPLIVPGHVALALRETAPERLARESLEEDGFPLFPDR